MTKKEKKKSRLLVIQVLREVTNKLRNVKHCQLGFMP